jgi:glycerol-3-phosphate acyltransferase PlsY
VATSTGALLGLAPCAVGVAVVSWVAVFLTTRYVSVASMSAAVIIACLSWTFYAGGGALLPAVLTGLAIVILWRHKGNIARLRRGTENRFEFKRHSRE